MLINEDIDIKQVHNHLVSLVKQYNQIPNSHTNKKYDLYRQILNRVKQLNYNLTNIKGDLAVLNNDKPIRTIANRTDVEEIQQYRVLTDYPTDFQMFVNKLINAGNLTLHNIEANANLDVAQKDILNNKKSVSANNTLQSLESMFESGIIRVKASKHTPAISIPIDEYFNLFNNDDVDDDSEDFWNSRFNNLEENKKNMKLTELDVNNLTTLILERIDYKKGLESMAIRKRDPEFFSEKYIEWNKGGYKTPTENSVFEFLQNNYEDLSMEDELIDAILSKLKTINESKENTELNKFLTKIKELIIVSDSYNLIERYNLKDISGWPEITYAEGGEHPDEIKDGLKSETQTLDLENCEFLKLNEKELVFYAGGDWQYPYTVTVKLINGELKVIDSRPYDKKIDNHRLKTKDLIKILKAEDLQQEVDEKDAKKKAEQYIKETNDMEFWKNWDTNEILTGIKEYNEYIRPWGLVSKYIKEYIKNNKPMKNENKTTNNLEKLIEGIVRPLLEGKSFDYVKAIKKADRELEYELNGPGWKAKDKAHKDKTQYDRKRDKKFNIDEDIEIMDEATYSFDSEDPNLQQKTDKLKNDTTLFNKDSDEIKINTESKKIVLTKNQIMEMNQLRQLNKKNVFTKNQIIEMLKKN